MADNLAYTPGTGATIASDDVGSVHYQRIKLVDATDGSSTAAGVEATPLFTIAGPTTKIEVDSAGLTTSATAYVAGDVLGSELTFANAVRTSGGRAVVESAVLHDNADIIGAVDLYLFDSASTPAADNAANSWSDANARKLVGIIPFSSPYDSALNRVATWVGAQPIWCAATSLFGVLVTRSAHTFFGAVGDLRVKLFIRYE